MLFVFKHRFVLTVVNMSLNYRLWMSYSRGSHGLQLIEIGPLTYNFRTSITLKGTLARICRRKEESELNLFD